MVDDYKDLVVLGSQDLTKASIVVNSEKKDLAKYWDRDYIHSCLNSIENHQHKMLCQFLWYSGVRITEALTLTKGNIDFTNYTIRIRWLKSRKYNQRVAPIPPPLRDLLQLYTAIMKSEERIFPISRQRAWQLTKKYFKGSPHQLRHSYAVNWLRCGGDIVTLHRILGHSKIQTTMEYLKIVPVDLGKELIKITF
jgi:integrase